MPDHDGHFVSTTSNEGAARYHEGVRMLLDGSPTAAVAIRHTLAADPGFGPALAALALALAARGDHRDARRLARDASRATTGVTRRDRQHVEVITLVVNDHRSRAAALGREHLREFPDDELVGHALEWSGLV